MFAHRHAALAIALSAAAICLPACGGPKAAPALSVTSVSSAQGQQAAEQFCADLAKMTDEKAIDRMAVRASEMKLSSRDQDAILDYAAASVCPQQF